MILKAIVASLVALGAATPVISLASEGWRGQAETPHYKGDVFPPWQKGENNDAVNRGFEFTIPEVNSLADFHGDITDPKLVLYVGGNYFFAMAPLVKAFEEKHQEYKGKIYWETIPPGLLVKQMKAGGTITSGNMTWTAKPDAYFAGLVKVKQLIDDGLLVPPAVPYVTNTLTIMVPKDNPAQVKSLADLGQPKVRLAMPNPEFEGIARQIKASLQKAGGEKLVKSVYEDKVKDGSTVLTHIHHRQTPLFLIQGVADAGVTWQSEAVFQEQVGHPISHVEIPAEQNTTAIYAGAEVHGAAHPDAAKAWLEFIKSPAALTIFERYGFKRYEAAGK
ncbi:glycine/betaine ABC transporter substrate-binding protein [Bradyrhizobium sp. UASWS1016]|jgi:ABC-type molybdate transport system substrate-binding protein|uniref:ABC transporter substrate-binding protein n=2 Tax=Nitrobacteraceae TaxID=41294 RepID=A0A5P6PH02_9BRAD|nr:MULTISPECIES: substrate-binding domain-containing protein [Bradyrhizobium]OYU86496.1 MAG: glycine/betaine ABC transporter substrate-binding protein [Bradyrhizobiaceae bacterium PARB1]AUD00236.1 glycine/betaine ABC transporter substrate-binding protein [Bradyrhizobium sp. SK17]MCS3730918.1 ABC-type molybdate transport system substrate-binding protein [Bradyrhizobium betae]OCX32573.1 glycine/betaine ABC transporter substrate-binding protein [Bradyrhizobium sp. UASWS1016]QFI77591.1 ABC transpo